LAFRELKCSMLQLKANVVPCKFALADTTNMINDKS